MSEILVHDERITINALQGGLSLARYGDGEIDLAYGMREEVFENRGADLALRMREILEFPQRNLLVGVPNVFSATAKARLGNPVFWERYAPLFSERLSTEREYHSAFISRPDNIAHTPGEPSPGKKDPKAVSPQFWKQLKTLWEGKSIGIVHFNETLLDHPIYENAASRRFIRCEQRNAWGAECYRYRDLLARCLRQADKVDLFLVSAGPVACVLASDLCAAGYQTIDIGQAPRIFSQWRGDEDAHLY